MVLALGQLRVGPGAGLQAATAAGADPGLSPRNPHGPVRDFLPWRNLSWGEPATVSPPPLLAGPRDMAVQPHPGAMAPGPHPNAVCHTFPSSLTAPPAGEAGLEWLGAPPTAPPAGGPRSSPHSQRFQSGCSLLCPPPIGPKVDVSAAVAVQECSPLGSLAPRMHCACLHPEHPTPRGGNSPASMEHCPSPPPCPGGSLLRTCCRWSSG